MELVEYVVEVKMGTDRFSGKYDNWLSNNDGLRGVKCFVPIMLCHL